MHKSILLFSFVSSCLLSFSASATLFHDFSCKSAGNLELKKPAHIQFTLKQLNSGKFNLVSKKKEGAFKVLPMKSKLYTLNKNTFLIQDDKKKLVILADKGGSVFVHMTLYKDAHYRTGFVRIDDDENKNGNHYSKITCQIQQKLRIDQKG